MKKEIFRCGPSTKICKCNCPDSCEHQWDGEWKEIKFPDGSGMATATCSKCGMWASEHDLWTLP